MAKDLQAQIEELKDRVSILEQLLVIGAELISEPVRPEGIYEEYIKFLMHNFPANKRTENVIIISKKPF